MSYITLANMGGSGGLCSQLQIYASLLAVAKANKKTIVFSKENLEGKETTYITGQKYQTKIRIFELLDLDYEIKEASFFSKENNFLDKHINFHTTTYDETLFHLDPNTNYNLVGRFDLYTYWYNDIGEEVSNWRFKESLQIQASERMSSIKKYFGNENPTVSIHIRRGDYQHPNHHFCQLDEDYYLKAILDNFSPVKNYNFIVFSNDIGYAKEMFSGNNVYFVDPDGGDKVCSDSEKEDLVLLSLCDNHITANSSYSWWGAYLSKNKSKKIVCPTNWLMAYHQSSWINGRFFPPNWINIDNKN